MSKTKCTKKECVNAKKQENEYRFFLDKIRHRLSMSMMASNIEILAEAQQLSEDNEKMRLESNQDREHNHHLTKENLRLASTVGSLRDQVAWLRALVAKALGVKNPTPTDERQNFKPASVQTLPCFDCDAIGTTGDGFCVGCDKNLRVNT